jgi:hypothetical protein
LCRVAQANPFLNIKRKSLTIKSVPREPPSRFPRWPVIVTYLGVLVWNRDENGSA